MSKVLWNLHSKTKDIVVCRLARGGAEDWKRLGLAVVRNNQEKNEIW